MIENTRNQRFFLKLIILVINHTAALDLGFLSSVEEREQVCKMKLKARHCWPWEKSVGFLIFFFLLFYVENPSSYKFCGIDLASRFR